MCDRIAIIDKGNLVALDTTQKLLDRIQTKKITFKVSKVPIDKNLILPGVQFNTKISNTVTAIYEKNSYKFDDIASVLKKNNIEILDISTEDGDLEDVFVQLTNN
jgi:ABC-2 type transport system ATP-binding protein